jgi:hypothetical protein
MTRRTLKAALPLCLGLTLFSLIAQAEGGISGGGGGATEIRINEIRADILHWIQEGGAQGLKLPSQVTYGEYVTGMEKMLAPQAVVIGTISTADEAVAQDNEHRVIVDGQPKTCRGFVSRNDRLPHILCNIERFTATSESDQYRLVHHEYAGLSGIERNIGSASDYEISSQLTDFLVPQTVLRLAIKPSRGPVPRWTHRQNHSSYKEAEEICKAEGERLPTQEDIDLLLSFFDLSNLADLRRLVDAIGGSQGTFLSSTKHPSPNSWEGCNALTVDLMTGVRYEPYRCDFAGSVSCVPL